MADDETPQSKGGKERAKRLSPAERRAVAIQGAQARWRSKVEGDPSLPRATHQGKMALGGIELDCYVLEDGRRLFHKRGMARSLGMKSEGGNVFLRAMQRKSLGSELGSDLLQKIENPINFKPLVQDLAHGYEASVLVEICKAIKRASDAGRLTGSQDGLVAQANAIIQALAKVGVVALIDEATGYQSERSPTALQSYKKRTPAA